MGDSIKQVFIKEKLEIMYTGVEIPRARGGRGHVCVANGEAYLNF